MAIINLLLDKGMSVKVTNTHGYTWLYFSVAFGNLEATNTSVERGADINTSNIEGNTTLMKAAYYGKLEIFRYLTQIGANIKIIDAKNNTAFTHLLNRVVWLLSCYSWTKECLFTLPTQMTLHRYIFCSIWLIWKQRILWSIEVFRLTKSINMVTLHIVWLVENTN
jgi:ankyrin repeat protein